MEVFEDFISNNQTSFLTGFSCGLMYATAHSSYEKIAPVAEEELEFFDYKNTGTLIGLSTDIGMNYVQHQSYDKKFPEFLQEDPGFLGGFAVGAYAGRKAINHISYALGAEEEKEAKNLEGVYDDLDEEEIYEDIYEP